MPDRAVYLLEAGLPAEVPGIAPRVAGASFPFWGTYTLLDFAFSALRCLTSEPCLLVCDTRDRQSTGQSVARWGRNAVRQRDGEDGLAELRRLASGDRAPWAVVSTLSYAAFLDAEALRDLPDAGGGRRLRADTTPLPVYVLPREAFVAALEEASRQPADAGGSLRSFVTSFLPSRFREHLDIPGKAFFVDNLMQLWDAHHFLREHLGGSRAARYTGALEGVQQPTAEAHIADSGVVKDSIVASAAQIEGTVVESVVFPGVHVRRGADVRQCVIMGGNRIGADARIANTLVLPCQQEAGGEAESIGAGVEIGDTRNVMHTRNDDYPRQIARGLTVIGMNATVPAQMLIGSGCYVGPGVAAGVLRAVKKLARGASVQ